MSTELREQNLRFVFDDSWTVIRYDDTREYDRIEQQTQAKGVDFVGSTRSESRPKSLCLIEVKDFRGHRIENRDRLSNESLAIEVARKVRDSVAGIVGAARTSCDRESWRPYWTLLRDAGCEIRVVFWLEQDPVLAGNAPQVGRQRQQAELGVLSRILKRRCRWLGAKALVTDQKEGLPGVRVLNLPGAGRA